MAGKEMDQFESLIILVSGNRRQTFVFRYDESDDKYGPHTMAMKTKTAEGMDGRVSHYNMSFPFSYVNMNGKMSSSFDHLGREFLIRMARSRIGEDRGWGWLFSDWYNDFASKRNDAESSWDHVTFRYTRNDINCWNVTDYLFAANDGDIDAFSDVATVIG
jgi:hypothetical protein